LRYGRELRPKDVFPFHFEGLRVGNIEEGVSIRIVIGGCQPPHLQ
jgi:hypothetical protein